MKKKRRPVEETRQGRCWGVGESHAAVVVVVVVSIEVFLSFGQVELTRRLRPP